MDPRKLVLVAVAAAAASAACGGGGEARQASAVVLVGGNTQIAAPRAVLPAALAVKVVDAAGSPVAGFPVAWSSSSGSVAAETTTTGPDGKASVAATLGAAVGPQTFTAVATGLSGSPITFTANATTLSCLNPAAAGCAAPVIVAAASPACGRYDPCPTSRPSACAKPIVPGPAGLAHHAVHTVGDVVRVDVPPGTASITVVEQAISAPDTILLNGNITIPNVAVPDKVRDPSGSLVYDDNPPSPPPPDPSGQLAFFASNSPVTGSFTIPNTSPMIQRGLAPGTWQFTVNDFAFECASVANCTGGSTAGSYDVSVVLKSAGPGNLDVAFYLVGTPLVARNAVADPGVQRMVSSLAGIYAGAGICLRNVTFYDVPAWAQAAYGANLNADDTSPCGDLDQMFTLSAPGTQLNLFLVDSLVAGPQDVGTVLGIDGTIPGPSAFGGTVHSGAAVNGSDLSSTARCGGSLDISTCGPDRVAYIAAHEGGHWLGLYHTTELDGASFDPLADTARCSCQTCVPVSSRSACANPDPLLPPPVNGRTCTASAACGGGEDLMFWLLDTQSLGTLSCDQAAVMRSNPAVQ